VAFVSDEEAQLFRSVLEEHRDRVVTLPNGVDTETFDPGRACEPPFQGRGAAFAFTGAMDYLPNIDAVTWFANEVFPAIRRTHPWDQCLIVRSKQNAEVRKLGEQHGVLVTGRVPSVAAYLAHAQVAVAPLRIARGIQNKVLEAMAMAMPIVVSSGALTGIRARSGEHLICAETPQEWSDACVRLVRDRAEASRLGQAARKLVLDEYTWEAQFARLDRLLR